MEKILQLALLENRPAVIIYQGKTGITRRKILVKKIVGGKVYAYCYLREKDRVFSLENILSAQLETQ